MTIPLILPGAECRPGAGLCLIITGHRGLDVVLSANEKEKGARKVKEPPDKGQPTD